ncbi:amino acid transporter [Athelia psychrophila]|uniref:Amino acid transporter n=1 Tax=Athelia psychrophila TaxID=1759441 RepID=A0A166G8Z7_9AGAM|nr:amino acid transporter [Fibularhizoctonia sp. CBS 109695]
MSTQEHGDTELEPPRRSSRYSSDEDPAEGRRMIDESQGAPTETVNPLGYEVTFLSAVMLNLAQLLGAGIYSVPGSVLSSVGSIGLLLLFWLFGSAFAAAGLSVYVEFASMFPNRSGAEVVYLEMAFPRPRFFVPTVFMLSTVLLSFTATNSIIFAQYFLVICGWEVTSPHQTAVAIGVNTVVAIAIAVSTKWSLRTVNLLTSMKVMSSIFMVLTGAAVLCGFTRVPNPYANFHGIFEGSTTNLNSLATAFVKINYSYVGWHNSFNVLGEVGGANPVRTIKRASYTALAIATALFFFINIAYVAAVPIEDIRTSGQLIAVLFFQRVFGDSWGTKLLPCMVALSCLGNIAAGQARIIREVARQGLLPYPAFFVSTKPFGTPIGPVALKYTLTVFVILVVPGKDAFNFMIFTCALVIGLVLLRKQRALQGYARSAYQAGKFSTSLFFLSGAFLLVMPWVPPEKGQGDVSFWYATMLCSAYYYLWIVWLPNFWGYTIVEEIEELDDGARTMRLVRHYHTKDVNHEEERPLLQGEQS